MSEGEDNLKAKGKDWIKLGKRKKSDFTFAVGERKDQKRGKYIMQLYQRQKKGEGKREL